VGWQQQNVFANLVVVFGPNESILIYSGTPALGNLIGSWAGTAGTDQYGNSYPAGLSVDEGEIFLYNGTPAIGNMIVSMSSVQGTDQFGNLYFPGITSYENASGTFYAASSEGGGLVFATASAAGGPYTTYGEIGSDGAGNLIIESKGSAKINLQGELLTPLAAAGQLTYIDNADGNTYGMGTLDAIVTSNQAINTTTLTAITALQIPVVAGWYMVEAIVYWTQGATAAGQNFLFNGPAASFVACSYFHALTNSGVSNGIGLANEIGSGGGAPMASPAFAAGDLIELWIKGPILFTASGTFGITCGNGTSGDHCTINAGAWLSIRPTSNQPG
jgi:hypothetical protein